MTSGDDDWMARVLAGDPVALRLLDLARTLSAEQFAAFVRAGERLLGGMPIAEVEELAWQEMDAVE